MQLRPGELVQLHEQLRDIGLRVRSKRLMHIGWEGLHGYAISSLSQDWLFLIIGKLSEREKVWAAHACEERYDRIDVLVTRDWYYVLTPDGIHADPVSMFERA